MLFFPFDRPSFSIFKKVKQHNTHYDAEQERTESQRMMADLLELKAQLAKKDGEETPPVAPTSEESTTDET